MYSFHESRNSLVMYCFALLLLNFNMQCLKFLADLTYKTAFEVLLSNENTLLSFICKFSQLQSVQGIVISVKAQLFGMYWLFSMQLFLLKVVSCFHRSVFIAHYIAS